LLLTTIKTIKAKVPSGFLLLALLLTGSVGCNTRIEGCLDLNADNFDFEAELACEDCCTYPKMNLSLTQKWNEDNFSNEDTLYDIHDQPYIIQDLKYFLSSWSWRDGEGHRYTVDSVNAACHATTLAYTPDILTTGTRQFSYTLGTIRLAPLTDSLFMTLGLVEDFSCLDPDDESTPSNITDQSPLWNKETGTLETLRLVLQRDLNTVTFDTVFLTTNFEFRLPYTVQLRSGFSEKFDLTVNYALWFQDADTGDLSSFGTSIINYLPGSISPTN
jgi:hypothetical protein